MPAVKECVAWIAPQGCGVNAHLDPEWSAIETAVQQTSGHSASCRIKLPSSTGFDLCLSFPPDTKGRLLTPEAQEDWVGFRIEVHTNWQDLPDARPLVWKSMWLLGGTVRCFHRYRHPLWKPANIHQIELKLVPMTFGDEDSPAPPYATMRWDVHEGTRSVHSYVHRDLPHGLELDDYARTGTPANIFRPGGLRRRVAIASDKKFYFAMDEVWRRSRSSDRESRRQDQPERLGKSEKRERPGRSEKDEKADRSERSYDSERAERSTERSRGPERPEDDSSKRPRSDERSTRSREDRGEALSRKSARIDSGDKELRSTRQVADERSQDTRKESSISAAPSRADPQKCLEALRKLSRIYEADAASAGTESRTTTAQSSPLPEQPRAETRRMGQAEAPPRTLPQCDDPSAVKIPSESKPASPGKGRSESSPSKTADPRLQMDRFKHLLAKTSSTTVTPASASTGAGEGATTEKSATTPAKVANLKQVDKAASSETAIPPATAAATANTGRQQGKQKINPWTGQVCIDPTAQLKKEEESEPEWSASDGEGGNNAGAPEEEDELEDEL